MTNANASGEALCLESATIRNVTGLQAKLVERLDESGALRIDGAAVERVDTAMLQLLAAFVRDVRADGRAVEWIACSVPLRRAVSALALEQALGLAASKN